MSIAKIAHVLVGTRILTLGIKDSKDNGFFLG